MVVQLGIFIGAGMMEDVALQVKTTEAQVNKQDEVLNSYGEVLPYHDSVLESACPLLVPPVEVFGFLDILNLNLNFPG